MLLLRGTAHLRLGEYALAVADFTNLLDTEPTNAKLFNDRGLAYSKQNQHDAASADFTKAIELAPTTRSPTSIAGSSRQFAAGMSRPSPTLPRPLQLDPKFSVNYCCRAWDSSTPHAASSTAPSPILRLHSRLIRTTATRGRGATRPSKPPREMEAAQPKKVEEPSVPPVAPPSAPTVATNQPMAPPAPEATDERAPPLSIGLSGSAVEGAAPAAVWTADNMSSDFELSLMPAPGDEWARGRTGTETRSATQGQRGRHHASSDSAQGEDPAGRACRAAAGPTICSIAGPGGRKLRRVTRCPN